MADMKKYLICVDSDGCAIDSMTVKHEKAFGPAFVEVWQVGEDLADQVLKEWNAINLYRMTRGINRFQGLVAILKTYPDLDHMDQILALDEWTKTTKALSPAALEETYEKSGLAIMEKALQWSVRVNELIDTLPLAMPFEGVKETMEVISQEADIAVVSSANPKAIEEEWKTSGLYDLVNYFYSQADGTKSECIARLLSMGYKKENTVMLGDAIGDSKAASNNMVAFYPILVTKEVKSWTDFGETYLPLILNDGFNELKQVALLNSMMKNLEQ